MNPHRTLLIDAGNSRIKWAWLDSEGLRETGSCLHTEDAFFHPTDSIWAQVARPARIIASNVAGARFAEKLTAHAQQHWQLRPEFITPIAAAFGITNAYSEPGRLGADRWAALIAAYHSNPGACCVVDCGTAITIDALCAEGKHLGGLILPGLTMMRSALSSNTQGLANTIDEPTANLAPFARDTAAAITSGGLYAVVAAIDRIVAEQCAAVKFNTLIITGGDAARIQPLLSAEYHYEPNLVLHGLAIIAREQS
ncbi:MAG: type III pantothenate kinase [Gammaproteobacteria bacterium]